MKLLANILLLIAFVLPLHAGKVNGITTTKVNGVTSTKVNGITFSAQILRVVSDQNLGNWILVNASTVWQAIEQGDSKAILGMGIGVSSSAAYLAVGTDPVVRTGFKLHIKVTTIGDGFTIQVVSDGDGVCTTVSSAGLSVGNNTVDLDPGDMSTLTDWTNKYFLVETTVITTAPEIDEIYLETP